MSDYRLKITVRNARLLRAIEKAGHKPGWIFANQVGIDYARHLLGYLNLKRTPFDEVGDLRPDAERLCVFLNCLPDELWSEEQRYPLVKNTTEVELSAENVHQLLTSPSAVADPLCHLEAQQAAERLDAVLATLKPREAEVLRLRYGIDGDARTFQQIGDAMGLSADRIRQLEVRALRQLRHPSRASEIKDYLGAK